jgi:hypothetical protein
MGLGFGIGVTGAGLGSLALGADRIPNGRDCPRVLWSPLSAGVAVP